MLKHLVMVAGLLLVGGCTSVGGDITSSPENWAQFLDHTVTVKGNAGNSPQGAIVRLDDGGYIPLRTREKWGIDAVGRPVIVTGKVISGEGFRAEKYVLQADKIEVPPPDQSAQKNGLSGL